MNKYKMQRLWQLAIQNQMRYDGVRQEARDRSRAIARYRKYEQLRKPHIIHTPIQQPSRLNVLVRKSVLTIETLIQFVKGLFK